MGLILLGNAGGAGMQVFCISPVQSGGADVMLACGIIYNDNNKGEDNKMGFFDTLRESIESASQYTADLAKKTAESIKLRDGIRRDKKEIRRLTYEIGQTFLRLHADDCDEVYQEFVDGINSCKASIEEKLEQLAALEEKSEAEEFAEETEEEWDEFFDDAADIAETAKDKAEEAAHEAGEAAEEAAQEVSDAAEEVTEAAEEVTEE